MRKMNKIVALSLVLAMALSMMASAASFKDQATINEDLIDEINMMVALNVYSEQGTGAGNFEPNGTITRAQAAKMIYVLKNKGNDNGATSWTGMNIFSDVEAGAWYEGYVNYCASTGILAGTGDGKYNPNGQLTGVELAKLLLVVNGYKADVQGYTGDNWANNILADAEAAGMFEDYELPVKGIVTREWAAKLFVNGITEVAMVKYEDGELTEQYGSSSTINLTTGEITTSTAPLTYAGHVLSLNEAEGILTATPRIELGKGALDDEDNDKSKVGTVSFEFDANDELLGQYVTVLYKGESLAKADKVYGVTAHEDVVAIDTTVANVYYTSISGNETYHYVTAGEVKEKVEINAPLTLYTDYKNAKEDKITGFDGMFEEINDNRAIKMIDNDGDGDFDVAFVGSVKYGQVTYHNSSNHTLRAGAAISISDEDDYEDIVFVDEVAEDDYIKVTEDYSTGSVQYVVEKLDVVTGTITKASASSAVIDGTTYKRSANHIMGKDFALNAVATSATKEVNLVVDGNLVIATDSSTSTGSETQTDIALIIHAAEVKDDWTGEKTPMVEVLLKDGTQKIYEYDTDLADNPIAFENVAAAKTKHLVAEYVVSGDTIALVSLQGEGIETLESGKFDKSEDEFIGNGTTYVVDDDTYFFVIDSSDPDDIEYAVVNASEISGDMAARATTKFGYAEDGIPYLYFAVLEGTVESDDDTGYGVAASTVYTEYDEDGTKIYTLVVTTMDGSTITLKNTKNVFGDYTRDFIIYDLGSSDNTDTVAMVTITEEAGEETFALDAVEDVVGNKIVLENAGYKTIADDVEIYYVDAYETTSGSPRIAVAEGTGIVDAAELDENGTLAKNILFNLDDDGYIDEIIVEVDGDALLRIK